MMAGAMIRETIPTESGTIVEASLHASHLITLGHQAKSVLQSVVFIRP
jgi:hypothetical protein